MTLIGKIFTMLILILSVLFLGFSLMVFATHTNWRERYQEVQKQLQDAQQQNQRLKEQVDQLKSSIALEQAARRFALAALHTKLQDAEDRLSQMVADYEQQKSQLGMTAESLQQAQQALADLTTRVQNLRQEIRTAQENVDAQFLKVVQLTDEINQQRRVRQDLEQRQGPLARQIAMMKDVITKLGVRMEVQPDGTVLTDVDALPPKVDGVVVDVSERNHVEISLGSDDGIKVGHQLDVYRQGTYLGRIIILETWPDRAVGEILPGFSRGKIRKGDRVATKLS